MSWPRTHRASSEGIYDDAYGLSLEQTTPHLPQNLVGFIKDQGQSASTFQCSDRDLRADERISLGSEREQGLIATLNSRPAGCLYELNHELTSPKATKSSGSLFESEHKMPSHGSRADLPEVLAFERTNRTARAPSRSTYTPLIAVANSQLQCLNGIAIAPLSPKDKPLNPRSKASSGADADLAVAPRDILQDQMIRMPAEICQMIMDIVFEDAFGPRRVHPHKDPPIMNIFLALNKVFYRKYHEQYWTKNTWIISKGPLNETMRFMTEKPYNEATTEFSLQTPNKAALQIKSVELSFSKADTPDLPEWQQLIHTWQDKFDRIAMLNLNHLTLDFTEAYDPDELYLGVYLVPRLIPFAHGMPADFRILAPDSWVERQIRDAFLVLNAG